MAISDTQKVDLLYKKIAWSVSKTDTQAAREAYNEAVPSPLLIRGDSLWQLSGSIPSTIPSTTSSIVQVYKDGGGSYSPTVECTEVVATDNRTWSTGLTDWIDPQFGSTYFVKVYVSTTGNTTPQTSGTSLQAAGLNDDQWYFDYQAGILNFIGTNVPTAISAALFGTADTPGTGRIFISGARYIGPKGATSFSNGLTIGNITINGNTISGNTNITLTSNVTTGNVLTNGLFYPNGGAYSFGSTYGNGNVATFLSNFGSNTITTTGNITVGGISVTTYPTAGNIRADLISPYQTTVTTFDSSTAIGLPTGANIARPSSPIAGYIRYNNEFNAVEFYNGTGWISVVTNIDGENFAGDGTTTYTLRNVTTANGILVSINGTVQQPTYAYSVSGTTLTFTEAPTVTDQIDIRYLAVSQAGDNIFNTDVSITGNITVTGLYSSTPTTKTASSAGVAGQICWDANYIYVCTATNTWKRSALTGGF